MSRIKELIRKLWEGKLSSIESRELDELINHKDADFKNDLEKHFYSAIAAEEQEENISRKAKVISIRRYSWQVAASLLFALLLIELFFPPRNKSVEQQQLIAGTGIATTAPEWIQNTNNTTVDMHIRLSDGSEVKLSPGSAIRYKKRFDRDRRDVSLTGKAYFTVVKNPAKPFSVITGEYATMALGTSFEVNTFDADKLVVRLFTGKVKVYAPGHANSFDAVYLTPGQLVSINIADQSVKVSGEIKPVERQIAKAAVTPADKSNDLHFQNASLADVFSRLSVVYQIPIEYHKEQIEGLYFTGAVLQADSLKNIITLIANMNGLSVIQIDNHFVIQKK